LNPSLILGIVIVTGALMAYSVAVLTEQRKKCLTPLIMTFLTIGISLDITGTACMIIGSRNIPFTVHGVLGYSALSGMLVDTLLTWRHWNMGHKYQIVSKGLLVYTRIAYLWWVIAYIAGGAIAAFELR
jgi:hypothetical protein